MITTARGQVSGFRFAVASPHNLTSTVAAQVLDGGGNAVDAAIAANAVQGTVAPETCGIGGDLFALVWEPGASSPAALNASGWAGSGVSASDLRDQGFVSIPDDHPASVSIPGAVAGWFELARRFGSRQISDLLAPAMAYAADGFPASSEFSRATAARFEQLAHQPSAKSLYPDSTPAEVGARIQRPLLHDTFAKICSDGSEGFYRGSVARDVSDATGGLISVEDLASFAPDWVEPLGKSVLGHTGWTIGPNSQGYLTLAALRIFEMTGGAFDPDDPASHHRLIESYRAVAAERDDVVSDPTTAPLAAAALLADDRLSTIADSIGDHAGTFSPPSRRPGGTAYLTVVDGSGLAISLIQSNFHGIGSNIGAGSSGFILHNRGVRSDPGAGPPERVDARETATPHPVTHDLVEGRAGRSRDGDAGRPPTAPVTRPGRGSSLRERRRALERAIPPPLDDPGSLGIVSFDGSRRSGVQRRHHRGTQGEGPPPRADHRPDRRMGPCLADRHQPGRAPHRRGGPAGRHSSGTGPLMGTLILVRHGEAEGNSTHRLIGWADVPLTDTGHRQAIRVAERLRSAPVARIVSSDLRRTTETAAPLVEATGVTLELEPRLREIDNGDWTDLSPDEISARWTDLWESYVAGTDVDRPNGERWADVGHRVIEAVSELLSRDGITVVFTHGGPLLLSTYWAAGTSVRGNIFRGPLAPALNASVSTIVDGPRVLGYNDVGHLTAVADLDIPYAPVPD